MPWLLLQGTSYFTFLCIGIKQLWPWVEERREKIYTDNNQEKKKKTKAKVRKTKIWAAQFENSVG